MDFLSPMGFGAMGITAFYGAPMEDEDALKLLKGAYDKGYRHFDTAEIYNTNVFNDPAKEPRKWNEEIVGKFVATVKRETVTVATKFNPMMSPDVEEKSVVASFDNSLKRLGCGYVDLYYLHRMPGTLEKLKKWMAAAATLVKAGKVKHIGLSEVSGEWLREAHKIHPVAAVQQEWSLLTREPIESNIVPVCAELGIAVVAYSPLARNLLTEQKEPPKDWRATNPRYSAENWKKNQELVAKIGAIAKEKGVSTAQISLKWLYQKAESLKVKLVAIPGTTKLANAESNIEAITKVTLSDSDMKLLEEISALVNGLRGDERYLAGAADKYIGEETKSSM